ncbi:MAG: TetR/AcrR family transcriptional regulator [Acidimicrobiales bacterium]
MNRGAVVEGAEEGMAVNAALVARDRARDVPSPNRLAKRDEIVSAAVEVLLRDGVHKCTVRAIATAAGVSKGAVHYYFSDVDEIVDMAMAQATRGWIAWLRSAAGTGASSQRSASERFWRVIAASVQPFARGDRTLMPLWLDYWAACTRAQRTGPIGTVHGLLTSYVAELLAESGVPDPLDRSMAVTCYLFGAGMQEPVQSMGFETVVRHVAMLSGVEPPSEWWDETGHMP